MRVLLSLSILLVFSGCSLYKAKNVFLPRTTSQQIDLKKPKPKHIAKPKPKPKPKEQKKEQPKEVLADMLRGVIISQRYNRASSLWIYTLKIKDIANGYSDTKTFVYPKKLYNEGDLVYATFYKRDLNKLKNLYLVQKNYKPSK